MVTRSVERDWMTESGLRAIATYTEDLGFRCGYVAVPIGHPLYGVDYNKPCSALQPISDEAYLGKRGVIPLLLAAWRLKTEDRSDVRTTPELVFDAHGSLTFSGFLPVELVETHDWFFGFDCAHAGDRNKCWPHGEVRTLGYVSQQCEWLAEQIVAHPYRRV